MKKFGVKKFIVSICALLGLTCVGVGATTLEGTAAADSNSINFEIMGASVRTAAPDGIRFIAQAEAGLITDTTEYGVIIIPADMDNGSALTLGTKDALVITCEKLWDDSTCEQYGVNDGFVAFSGALVASKDSEGNVGSFPEAFYNRPLTAVAFITSESGETMYTQKVTRSISYVATLESLSADYKENEVVEKIAASATMNLTVNDGGTLTNLLKAYNPTLTIGGVVVDTPLANISYESSNEDVAMIVGGKVQPTGDGETTITATLSRDGERTVVASVDVSVDVIKDREWVVLNDATGDFSAYSSGTTVSGQPVAGDPVGTGFIKVTSQVAAANFFLPLKENGIVVQDTALVERFSTVKLSIYVPATLKGNIVCNAGLLLAAGTTAGLYEIEFTAEEVKVNYNNVGGMFVEMLAADETVYFGQVTAYTAKPNYNPERLPTPIVEMWEDGTATWAPVEGATAYAVAIDGLNFTVTNETSVKIDGKGVVRVKALGDGLYYKDSAYSQAVSYYQKDLLNACEDTSSVEAVGETTILAKTLSTEHVFQGEYALALTSESGGWYFSLALNGAPTLAELQAKYDRITFNVHSTYPDMEGVGAANNFRYGFWGDLITLLGYGKNVISLDTATIPESAYADGKLIFTVGGACTLTIDNVVGVYSSDADRLDCDADMLNNCETVQWWIEAYSASTPTLSTANVFEGNNSVEATGLVDGWILNVRIMEVSPTLEQLKAKYETIKLNVYSSYPGTNTNNLWLGDAADYNDWQARIVAKLSEGNNVVRISTAMLDESMYSYTESGGGWLTFRVGGACTLRVDNVVGTNTPYFGNAYIIGDSYSTFEGWVPYDEWSFYFETGDDVNAVEKTWWHQVLSATGSNLLYDDAIGGTTIGYTGYKENGVYQDYKMTSFITRFIQAVESGYLKDNHVDTIFVFGGTNDAWAEAPLGTPKYSGWTEADLYNVYPAISYLIKTIHDYLPDVKIVVLGNAWGYERYIGGGTNTTNAGMISTFGEIVAHYKTLGFDVDYIPVYLTDAHIANNHPNSEGMTVISNTILNYYN